MGAFGTILNASWALLDALGGLLGVSWIYLTLLSSLGRALGTFWKGLGSILDDFCSIFGGFWEQKSINNFIQKTYRICDRLFFVFSRFERPTSHFPRPTSHIPRPTFPFCFVTRKISSTTYLIGDALALSCMAFRPRHN